MLFCPFLHIFTDVPEGLIPAEILNGTDEEKRSWLNKTVGEVIDSFAQFDDVFVKCVPRKPAEKTKFPCRAAGCDKLYVFEKTRSNHEKTKHGLTLDVTVTEPSGSTVSDHVKAHSEARLGFGLFLADMQDAIKEGDGERLMHLYRLALLYYKTYRHTHYAYSTLLLTVQLKATLSPQMAENVKWNRFFNGHTARGRNIPLDLHLEHLNNFLKSFLKGVGPNLTEASALRISKSLAVLRDLMEQVDEEIGLSGPSGFHNNPKENEDILELVKVFQETGLFRDCPGREYTAFPAFKKNLFSQVDWGDLWGWMRSKIVEFSLVPKCI